MLGSLRICSPVGVVCWSLHLVKNSMWWFVFVRMIFFWCSFRCMVLGSVGVASPRSSVWTAGITRSVCGVATFVGGGKSFSSSCSAVRWRVSVLLDGAGRISNVLAKIDGEVSVGSNWLLSTVDVLVMAGGVFFGA